MVSVPLLDPDKIIVPFSPVVFVHAFSGLKRPLRSVAKVAPVARVGKISPPPTHSLNSEA